MGEERGRSWWQWPTFLVWVLVIAGASAAFVLVWWRVPALLYAGVKTEDTRVKAIVDTRTALLAGLVGIGALGTFWLNSRVYRITVRTFQVTERGHVTDRYSKAIEHLGEDSLDVRLGGIYALEQIARDSAQPREDQTTIVEVLSAFVRVHSDPVYQFKAAKPRPKGPSTEAQLAVVAADYVVRSIKPPVDVQAAVTVLGRLRVLEMVSRADLTGATLRHITLYTNLAGVALSGADLTAADLRGSDLTGANLQGATLTGAKLHGADLTGANLVEADLTEAELDGANLTEARLTAARLTKANLRKAIIRRADLFRATLTEANLIGSYLDGATLISSDLQRAYLSGSDLQGAKLGMSDLTGAKLHGANLTGVNLDGAKLHGAHFTEARVVGGKTHQTSVRGLTQAQLDQALGDHGTRLPADLRPPTTWDAQ
jgi:uncharacterized protein YjbI with pentapeptide repeats